MRKRARCGPGRSAERKGWKAKVRGMLRETYKAERIGAFVHDFPGKGEMVSVYSRAWNIRSSEGILLSIVEDSSQMTSLSLSVPYLFQNFQAHHRSFRAGEAVRIERDSVNFNGWCIDLSVGKPWDGLLRSHELKGFTLDKLPLMREALLSEGKKEGLLGIIGSPERADPFLSKALQVLSKITWSGIGKGKMRGLFSLVGLGKGLTPSGDDFIAGVLLGEETLGRLSGLGRKTETIDREEMKGWLVKTNDGGRTLLWLALRGHFPCYLIEVLKGAARAEGFEEIREAVFHAVVQGETSGTDALAGFLWYLEKATRSG